MNYWLAVAYQQQMLYTNAERACIKIAGVSPEETNDQDLYFAFHSRLARDAARKRFTARRIPTRIWKGVLDERI